MRIAFVVGSVFPAISETFIVDQIIGLIRRGHEVDVYAEKPEHSTQLHPDIEKYRILERTYYHQAPKNYLSRLLKAMQLVLTGLKKRPITTLNSINFLRFGKKAASLRLLYQVSPHLDKPPYDIVHCHFGYNGLKALPLRDLGLLQGKLVTTFHGLDLSQDIQFQGSHIYNQLFERGDLFLPISQHWQQKLIELGCDQKKVLVHRMGIDRSSFAFIPRRNTTSKKVRLISVCRLTEKKGLEYSIRAVAALAKSQPDIEYKIIGDGDLRSELQQLIQDLKVDDFVELLGWRQKLEIIELLKNSDIFLAPSITSKSGDQEGIPVALMEAMAIGLPVISTLHSGIPELVKDNVSGFLVAERDVQGLAEKINRLIENPEMQTQMGYAGYHYVRTQYDIEILNDRLVEIYRHLLVPQQATSTFDRAAVS